MRRVALVVLVWAGLAAGCAVHHPVGSEDYAPLLEGEGGPGPGRLAVTFFEIPHGDSYLIEFPNGRTLLVDGGFDSRAEPILTYLRARAIGRLDGVLLTHSHWDHFGGLPRVVREVPVGAWFDNGAGGGLGPWRELEAALEAGDVRRCVLRRGDRLDELTGAEVTIEVLLPDEAAAAACGNANRGTIVLSMVHGRNRFLLLGDAEFPEERRLLEFHGSALRSDVLKLGHHASPGSGGEEFLRVVRPRIAVAQGTAFANVPLVYPRPNHRIRRVTEDLGCRLLTGREAGAIQVVSDGDRLEVRAARSR